MLEAAANGLVALAPKLSPEQITRGWDVIIAVLGTSQNRYALVAAGNVLVALAPKLSPEQITRGWNAIIAVMERSEHWTAQQAAGNGLVALAPKLNPQADLARLGCAHRRAARDGRSRCPAGGGKGSRRVSPQSAARCDH